MGGFLAYWCIMGGFLATTTARDISNIISTTHGSGLFGRGVLKDVRNNTCKVIALQVRTSEINVGL